MMKRMPLWHSAIFLVSTALLPVTVAQSASEHKLEFDAVSVRPGRKFFMKGNDFLDPVSKMAPPPGGLFSWNAPLAYLVIFAYDLKSSQERRQAFEELPKPYNTLQDGWFAIEARAEGRPSRDDVRQMVRSMLEDRFHFAAHTEKRDGDILALEVDKPGLLKPHAEGAPCTLASSITDSNKYPHAYPSYQGFPARCGVFNRELSHSGERRLEMLDVTMDQIANTVSGMEPAPVVDRTGLAGSYDAVLDYGPAIPPSVETSDDSVGALPLPGALEKQLGLKLVKQRGQVDAFVIDHCEPPSEN